MLTFTVHEPPSPPADRIDRAESLVFIKDGFSWAAALFAPLWMIAHRLWWPLLGYAALTAAIEVVRAAAGLHQWLALAALGLNLIVGFEADTLRRWALERRGWRMLGAVTGRTVLDCERRFFDTWLPAQPVLAPREGDPGPAPRSRWPVIGSLLGARS
jgi:hypothetical protein